MNELSLIWPPFGQTHTPSIAIGQLLAEAKSADIKSNSYYATLSFAEIIGADYYESISKMGDPADLIGEWVFSSYLFNNRKNSDNYPRELFSANQQKLIPYKIGFSCQTEKEVIEILHDIRSMVPRFIDKVSSVILNNTPRIIGLSSTFQQNCSALSIIKRIKELDSSIVTIMGGPNCEGTMGHTLVKNFKFLDYAYSGMANGSFSQIIKALLEEESNSLKKFPQLLSVNSMVNVEDNINNSINLNTIPIPDYDDYFDALGKSKLSSRIKPGLLYESSRGCWHSKCTFCGLNGTLKNYSSKKQSKVFDDLIKLSNKYSTRNIEMTDNVMSKSLFKALIPDLMGLEKKLNIFYETRSNLSEDQIRSLAKAGVKWIQIGIETLNPNIEKLLNKDNHVIDSISILKFCIENGITASWNLLYDIPGDKEEWYYEIDNLIPQIEHLFPPSSVVKLRFDRFSEYHKKANNYNLKLKPRKSYFNIYPFSRNDMDNFAYFFENSSINKCFEKEVVKKIKRKVSTWRENFYNNKKTERSYLVFKEVEKSIYIYDYRKRREPKQYKLTGDTYLIYKACRSPTTINEISKSLKLNNTKHKVQHILDFIAKKGLILNFGDKYLSLATSCQLADFTEFDDFPGGRLLASLE